MQHLLGLLPEAEQERLDTLSISDDTVAARLCDAESDLVDAYVRGDLVDEELDRFMTHYLTSERRRRKVLFAQSLLELERERGEAMPLLLPNLAARDTNSWSNKRWMAWAAAIVVSVVAGTIALDDLRLRRSLSGSIAALSALETRVRTEAGDLKTQEAQTGALKEEVSRLEGMVTDLKSASGAAANAKPVLARVASFLLAAPTRGVEATPVLTLAKNVEQLSVELKLDDPNFSRYRVSLKSRAGEVLVWQSPVLAPDQGKQGAALRLDLPADRVGDGAYSFDVAGIDRGRKVPVANYPFDVHREE